ncbi:MAG TPA: hypothetical protein GXZ63_03240 [Mollicutes bacterium]|jgi:hypothetical protein|nr:hypothetical protein [Mollicutes bacterium]
MKKDDKKKTNITSLIKLIKSNKRYRALFTLGLYFIFFAFVIASFSSNNYQTPSPALEEEAIDILEQYKSLSNYDFEYQITYSEKDEFLTYNFNGKSINETIEFSDENNQYLIKNDLLYQIIEDTKEEIDNKIIVASMGFTPSYLYDIIKRSNLESRTENYNDKRLTKQYVINLQELVGLEVHDQIKMLILTTENEENIEEVIISFEDLNSNKVAFNDLQEVKIKYLSN